MDPQIDFLYLFSYIFYRANMFSFTDFLPQIFISHGSLGCCLLFISRLLFLIQFLWKIFKSKDMTNKLKHSFDYISVNTLLVLRYFLIWRSHLHMPVFMWTKYIGMNILICLISWFNRFCLPLQCLFSPFYYKIEWNKSINIMISALSVFFS